MTAIPNVTLLPAPPQRGQEASVFAQKADAFIDALVTFVPELNQFAQALRDEFYNLSVVKFTATSTTSVAIGTGSKTFAATQGVAFVPGQTVMVASIADPSKFMQGTITSYDAATGALVVAVLTTGGTGSRADWKIGLVPSFDIEARLAAFKAGLSPIVDYPEASAAEARAGTASRLISAAVLWVMEAPVALTDAATVALDLSTGVNFSVTIAGNRVLGAPSAMKPGQEGFIRVVQDATGGRTLSFNAAYKFLDGFTAPSLNLTAGTVTLLRYTVSAAGEVFISGGKNAGAVLPSRGYVSGRTYSGRETGSYQQGAFSGTQYLVFNITERVSVASFLAQFLAGGTCYGAIYSAVGGRPSTRLAITNATSQGTSGYTEMLFATPVLLEAGTYFFSLSSSGTGNVYGTTQSDPADMENMEVYGPTGGQGVTSGTVVGFQASSTTPPADGATGLGYRTAGGTQRVILRWKAA